MIGCTAHPDETWIAEDRIPVYDSIDGKIAFFLQPSDGCEPGMDMAGKVDMYTKVKCQAGEGWVTGGKFKKLPRNKN
ncbi:hypothetical protein [Burkholderia sp. D-99]|uniref:hypothetical protein n=1 Tax=unclassified Burkholderia TaxID=2613784 RepID=UPI001FB7A911|nr:hypothetical protein [Burkholderia sp. D-99]